MSVDDEMTLAIADIALGLHIQMQEDGRSMSADEIAALAMAISLQQAALWLEQTLDWDKERRLDLALVMASQYLKLIGQ